MSNFTNVHNKAFEIPMRCSDVFNVMQGRVISRVQINIEDAVNGALLSVYSRSHRELRKFRPSNINGHIHTKSKSE